MYRIAILIFLTQQLVFSCLITNCPRGGKRSEKYVNIDDIKPCISCGPGRTGQCFGPNICCGPFGCLFGTQETIQCQREGHFHYQEPCVAGNAMCRKNTGRCATEGICCTQESCHVDKTCTFEEKFTRILGQELPLDLYSLMNYQQSQSETGDK